MSCNSDGLRIAVKQTAANAAVEISGLFSTESVAYLTQGLGFPDLCINQVAIEEIAEKTKDLADLMLKNEARYSGESKSDIDPITCAGIWIKALSGWLRGGKNSPSMLFMAKHNGVYEAATVVRLHPQLAALALLSQAAIVFVRLSEIRTIDEVLSDHAIWQNVLSEIGAALKEKNPDDSLTKAIHFIAQVPSAKHAPLPKSGPK